MENKYNWKDVKEAIENVQHSNDNSDFINWINKELNNKNKDDFLRLNFSSLINSFLNIINNINDVNYDEETLSKILIIILKILEFNITHPSPNRILKLQQLSTLVNQLSNNKFDNYRTHFLLIKCIKSAIKNINVVNDQEHIELSTIILRTIILNLKNKHEKIIKSNLKNEVDAILWSDIVLNSFKSIDLILNKFKLVNNNDSSLCGEIIGLLKAYSFYGLPGYDVEKVSVNLTYSKLLLNPNDNQVASSSSSSSNIGKKQKKKKKPSKKQNYNLVDEDDDDLIVESLNQNLNFPGESGNSDSEFSSTDYDSINQIINHEKVLKNIKNKIRFISYQCLSTIVKVFDRKILINFWSLLIPDSSSSFVPNFNVLTSILKDPIPKIRSTALSFLHDLLSNGEKYVLTLTEERNYKGKQLSFIPVSLTLAMMIKEIHRTLSLVLFGEPNVLVLQQTFKCLTVLISCTPYNKLNPGLLTNICHKLLFLLSHKDIQIQNGCLIIFHLIFSFEPLPDEMKNWLISDKEALTFGQNIFQFCIEHLSNHSSLLLTGESLKVLSSFLRSNIIQMTKNFIDIKQIMNLANILSNDDIILKNQVIQNLTCKYLLSIGSLLKHQNENQIIEVNEIKVWWISILKSKLITTSLKLDNSNQILISSQCIVIDFISTLPHFVFDDLQKSQKFYLITVLFAITKTNDDYYKNQLNFKSAAIRCLGVYQSFPSLTEDLSFLIDVSYTSFNILSEDFSDSKDLQLIIYQSSWTLANSTDIIKKNYYKNEEITINFLYDMLKVILNIFDINLGFQGDNIKTNFTRIIGNTVFMLIEQNLNQSIINDIQNAIKKLLMCLKICKSFKLHWNVCFAFSYLLSNEKFIQVCYDQCSIEEIYSSLVDIMIKTKNHKVQCYAVDALSSGQCQNYENVCDLCIKIVNFMIKNYSSVPDELKKNWFEKFSNSIDKLFPLIKNIKNEQNQDLTLCINNLKEFLLINDLMNDWKSENIKLGII